MYFLVSGATPVPVAPLTTIEWRVYYGNDKFSTIFHRAYAGIVSGSKKTSIGLQALLQYRV